MKVLGVDSKLSGADMASRAMLEYEDDDSKGKNLLWASSAERDNSSDDDYSTDTSTDEELGDNAGFMIAKKRGSDEGSGLK